MFHNLHEHVSVCCSILFIKSATMLGTTKPICQLLVMFCVVEQCGALLCCWCRYHLRETQQRNGGLSVQLRPQLLHVEKLRLWNLSAGKKLNSIGVFPKWNRSFIEFTEFSKLRESD